MRALVTGSEGFIGKNLVEALKARGDTVFEYDIKTGKDIRAVKYGDLPECDVIYCLACINQVVAEGDRFLSEQVNALSPLCMALEAKRLGAKLIFTSTASVYGNAKQIPTPSSAKCHALSIYARHKQFAEKWIKETGCDYTILRLSNVYGPHQTTENPYCGVVGRFFDQALKGEPLTIIGDGSQTRDFTYVGDVVNWLLAAAEPHRWDVVEYLEGSKGIFNVSHGMETQLRWLAGEINSLVRQEMVEEFVPERSVDGIKRRCLIPDLHCPTTLSEGLNLTYEWLKQHHKEQ